MAKPSWDEIDLGVRNIIAKDKGYHHHEIHDNDLLRDDLRYDDQSLIALAPDINGKFFINRKGLSPDDMVRCLKVVGIVTLIDEHPIDEFK